MFASRMIPKEVGIFQKIRLDLIFKISSLFFLGRLSENFYLQFDSRWSSLGPGLGSLGGVMFSSASFGR